MCSCKERVWSRVTPKFHNTHYTYLIMYSHVCVSHNTYQTCHSSCTPMLLFFVNHNTNTPLSCRHVLPCLCQSQHILHTSLIMCFHVCVSHNTHQTHHSSCTPMFVSITTHQTHHSSCPPMPVSVTTHTKYITHHVLPCLCQLHHTPNTSFIMCSNVCVTHNTH